MYAYNEFFFSVFQNSSLKILFHSPHVLPGFFSHPSLTEREKRAGVTLAVLPNEAEQDIQDNRDEEPP